MHYVFLQLNNLQGMLGFPPHYSFSLITSTLSDVKQISSIIGKGRICVTHKEVMGRQTSLKSIPQKRSITVLPSEKVKNDDNVH